jgi:HD-GYP domain-containing protein (c-di-GMP phosphodiesterase class II)
MGRITTVADVFDALTHERPYKEAWPLDEAIAEIARQRGDQFDPRVVDAFGRPTRVRRQNDSMGERGPKPAPTAMNAIGRRSRGG